MKQKRYWLRGGIILIALGVLTTLILAIFVPTPHSYWFPAWLLSALLGV